VDSRGQLREDLFRRAAIWARLVVSLFHLLQKTRHAHLDELVQVARCDGDELYALEQGVRRVPSFLENALVELHPGEVTIEEERLVGNAGLCHMRLGHAGLCRPYL